MNGHKLLKLLKGLSEDELEFEVHLYLHNSEDGEYARALEILKKDDEPYYKGDGPWRSGSAESDERLIYIRS